MIFDNKDIIFDESKHEYKTRNGNNLISVTTLISKFKCPFDPDGSILINCAQKKGVEPEELQKIWTQSGVDACLIGKNIHKDVEEYIKKGKILKTENEDLVKEFSKIEFAGKLHSETVMGNLDFKMAGTIDIVEIIDSNKAKIYDLKSNKKKPTNFCPFGNKMLYPIDHLYDTTINHYSLQLSLYAMMLEEAGLWIDTATILYVDRKKRIISQIPINFMFEEAREILEYHNEGKF